MKPFNLEKALAGEPVDTRDGLEVTQLHLFTNTKLLWPLFGIVNDSLLKWTSEGKRTYHLDVRPYDLFMKSTVRKGWIGIYADKTLPEASHFIYSTENIARKHCPSATAIVPVEWEE